jgi:hypothetical protein
MHVESLRLLHLSSRLLSSSSIAVHTCPYVGAWDVQLFELPSVTDDPFGISADYYYNKQR